MCVHVCVCVGAHTVFDRNLDDHCAIVSGCVNMVAKLNEAAMYC